MKTIIFDKTATYWTENPYWNLPYLQSMRRCLEDDLKYQGYLYLNQIYDKFGIGWDPTCENTLYRGDDGPIIIDFEPVDVENGNIVIHIKQ